MQYVLRQVDWKDVSVGFVNKLNLGVDLTSRNVLVGIDAKEHFCIVLTSTGLTFYSRERIKRDILVDVSYS